MRCLDLQDREHFRKSYLVPALDFGFVEMTLPDKPRSRFQKYRMTEIGKQYSYGHRRRSYLAFDL